MDAIDLVALFHRRWALPLLAELHRSGGAKFVTLVHRLGANQGAIRQTLDALIGLGLVLRNPGHGHPLRPEYLLTAAGESVAPECGALLGALRGRGVEEVGLRKWPMSVLHTLGGRAARYSEIRDRLPGITDRALAGALKELAAAGLLTRTLVDAYPPAVEYAPTPDTAPLLKLLDELARVVGRGDPLTPPPPAADHDTAGSS